MSVTAVPLQPIAKGSLTKLWLGVGLVIIVALALAWFTMGSIRSQFQTSEDYLAGISDDGDVVTTESGLRYRFLEEGEGEPASAGDVVTVKYEGRLRDGTLFDSNDTGVPFPVGSTIPGFDEALQIAPAGSKIELWLPPELAYGDQEINDPQTGETVIPANSVLNFIFEVVEIRPKAEVEEMMKQQQALMEAMQAEQAGQ